MRTLTRTVFAPMPSPASADVPPNRVLSAEVAEDEEVQWLWTSTGDGVTYVSGYNIVTRLEPEVGAENEADIQPHRTADQRFL